jgi:hypothetical protein
MAGEQSGRTPAAGDGNGWLTAVASLMVGAAFLALWFWLLPRWLGFRVEMAGAAHWRWLAAVPSVLGFAVAVRCVWDFGWTGRGTPAPIAPPTFTGFPTVTSISFIPANHTVTSKRFKPPRGRLTQISGTTDSVT